MNTIKKIALNDFLETNKNLPIQGSDEWLSSRFETIGGSEISTILNINKYQSIKQLIEQKIGISNFKKSAPLWFGNIFEYILQQYTEILFDTKIHETGSIPYSKSQYIKYSPDGIALIKQSSLNMNITNIDYERVFKKSKFNNDTITKKELLILFEFKNPFMRTIKKNEIPEHYINQPKLGMEVIDICELSIFIESVFRFCSYSDIKNKNKNNNINSNFNRNYHFDKNKYTNHPLCYGAFTIYYEKSNNSSHLLELINDLVEYINTNNIHEFDLSNIKNKNIINKIMENIIDYKDLKIKYHSLCINTNIYENDRYFYDKYNNLNKFTDEIIKNKLEIQSNNNLEYLGIMSFKMLDININPIYKDNPINIDILDKIEKIINLIKECNKLNSIADKKQLVNQFKI